MTPLTLVGVLAVTAFVGCGGGGDAGSGTTGADPTASVTVEQFKAGFAEQTGIELTPDDFPGDTVLLQFDDDGEAAEVSEAEAAFLDEYGAAQIYVVEADGDPDMILDVLTGENADEAPVEVGGEKVRLVTKIAEEPDADGVVWVERCIRSEEKGSLSSCSWTGIKRYGSNVIVSWTAAGDTLDGAAAKLDEAVSATVAGI